MILEIRIPSVGESVTSATISRWHVADGSPVAKDALLVTLETDKVSQELLAEEAGVVTLLVKEGDEVEIGTLVATIDTAAAIATPAKPEAAPAAPASAAPATLPAAAPAPVATKPEPVVAPPPPPVAAVSLPPAPVVPRGERETRRKMSPLRRKIAAHLVNAQHTAAILTTFNECDMSGIMALRKKLQDDFVKRYGVKLGFMSFFIKASVDALRAIPQINARIEGGELVEQHYFDISIAVGTEKGLVVPVIRDCDQKSFAQIEQEILEVAVKARDGKLELADLQGGVFTISNGGVYGSLLSTPILNPPQSAILGMHSIKDRPIAENGQVVIRPMMNLALSYDHRIVDGKEAVLFLTRIKDCIENPSRLLVGA